MKRISLLFLFIGLVLNGQTFELEWSKTYGGSGEDRGHRIFRTPDGGYMAFGTTTSTDGDISNPPFPTERVVWFIKTDSEGNMLWEKTLPPISGEYLQSFNAYEIPGTGFLVPAFHLQEHQSYLVMTDYDINILWVENISHIHFPNSSITDVMSTNDGGYLSIISGNDLKKLNQNFEVEWEKNYFDARTLYELPDGSLIILRRINHDFGVFTSLVKLSEDGDLLWEYSHPTYTWFLDVLYTSDNNLIAVGMVNLFPDDDDDFDYDYIIMKMTPEGEVIWTKNYGGTWSDWGKHIYEREEGGYIVSGWTQSFDGDVSHSYGLYDYWIIVLDENGDLQCEKSFGGSDYDESNNPYWKTDIEPGHDGGYVFITNSMSSDYDVSENKGGYDYWFFKTDIDFDECGNMSVIDTNHQMEVSIYPNPVENGINIKAGEAKIQKIQLYDMTGRVILEKEVNSESEYRFDLTRNVTKGNYILKVFTDKGVRSFKILKNK